MGRQQPGFVLDHRRLDLGQSAQTYCELGAIDPGATATISATFVLTEAVSTEMFGVIDFGSIPYRITMACRSHSWPSASSPTAPSSPPGGSLTTDGEADGAAPDDPIETTVDLPAGVAGGINIAERSDPGPAAVRVRLREPGGRDPCTAGHGGEPDRPDLPARRNGVVAEPGGRIPQRRARRGLHGRGSGNASRRDPRPLCAESVALWR